MRADRTLGDKIGPRLSDLIARTVIATRRELAVHEARARAAGTQQVIDRAGLELAELYGPLTARLLTERAGQMHPDLATWLGRVASGSHQWESLLGHVQIGFSGAIASAINNLVAPLVYELNVHDSNLIVDPQTAALAAASGVRPVGEAVRTIGAQGFTPDAASIFIEMSRVLPGAEQLLEMYRRGIIDHAELLRWLGRSAVHPELRGQLTRLARTLLSPADAALGVLRGNIETGRGEEIAAANGVDAGDFHLLVANTGEPPGVMQLLEAYRRGFIDKPRLERGIRQSRVRDEWIPTLERLRYEPMTTADAADAALRGHITEERAAAIANLNGLEPADWPAYFANQGNPPSNEQLLELWRRGFIDQATVRKGVREGRTRDEWIDQIEQLRYEPISTADAVDAWLRGHIDKRTAERLMAENGLMPRDHEIAFGNAGNPLSLTDLMEALRRGYIDKARFVTGFRESRYRDEWAETAYQLRHSPMSTAEAIEASVQGWLTKAEAERIAQENGLDPGQFEPLWNTYGLPLSRTEAEELYNRGEITLATLEQALRESRLKDRFIPDAVKLHVRLPEARQILTMVEFGALSHPEAARLLAQTGYPAAIIAAMLAEAEARSTGGHRQVATAQITSLYESKLIDRGTAAGLLARLHYTSGAAGLLLDLADHNRRMRILDTGITAVRNQFVQHHSDETQATADLMALHVPPDAAGLYLAVWQIERRGRVRELTEAQIVKAHKLGLFDTPDDPAGDAEAQGRLELLGYSPDDAQLLLAGA